MADASRRNTIKARFALLFVAGVGILFIGIFAFLAVSQVYRVSPRGGGGGLQPEPTLEQSVIQKPEALPAMCVVPTLSRPPKDMQVARTCTVTLPQTLQVNSYCLNPVTKLGGATVILPQGTSTYINLPPNCSVVVEEEKLYAKKVACYGPSGSKVTITVRDFCAPPDANWPVTVDPSCPPDFALNEFGGCVYQSPPNPPPCPSRSIFLPSQNCCMEDTIFGKISTCPEGYLGFQVWKPDIEENKYIKTTTCIRQSSLVDTTTRQSYTITLGTCGPNNKKDAKPNTDDNAQPGCVIDPATGACP